MGISSRTTGRRAEPLADLGQILIAALVEKQRAMADQSDRAFAAHLGVTRELWQKTRKGTIPMARTVALAVNETFADLRPLATAFLLTPRGNPLSENGNPTTASSGNPLPQNEIRQPQEATR